MPRKAGSDLQNTFESLMEQLFGKITMEYENNKSAKQQVIESAKELLESDDTRAAIDAAKKLQSQWKLIGKSWYKEDQQLWQDFRKHCDVIFERRNQEMEIANSQHHAVQQQAEALLAKLDAILVLDLPAITAAKADIETIKSEFFALELPRDSANGLMTRLNSTFAAIAAKVDQERNKAEVQSWVDLFDVCNAIREYEIAVIAATSEVALISQKESLSNSIANTPRWPTGTLSVLQQRLAKADVITAQDQANNSELLRILTIRAEILAGQESPEKDKALRMNYQVQQMQQAFGSRDASFDLLVLEWIALSGVSTENYTELLARFNAARRHGVKK